MAMTKSEESRILAANKDVVVALAKKYSSCGVDFDDLVQEGSIGFLTGMRKWTPEGGASLRTYAGQWAHAAIRRAVGEKDGKICPEPSAVSLDRSDEDKRSLHEMLPSSTFENPEEAAVRNERMDMIIAAMSPIEASIFRKRLAGEPCEDIANDLGISRSLVYHIASGTVARAS